MRVINKPKDDRNNPEPGKTYKGTVVEYKYTSGKSSKNGQPWYGLTLLIKPVQADLYKVKAFDFIGEDETGYFVYAESKMETWIKRIMNISTLETFRMDHLVNKPCLFVVEKSPGKVDPKHPNNPPRDFYNVSDILCPPIEEVVKSAPAAEPTPAATPTAAPAAGIPETAKSQKPADPVSRKADWSDGEVL